MRRFDWRFSEASFQRVARGVFGVPVALLALGLCLTPAHAQRAERSGSVMRRRGRRARRKGSAC
jgi:hypothetical protein